jgi:hypothetical protein
VWATDAPASSGPAFWIADDCLFKSETAGGDPASSASKHSGSVPPSPGPLERSGTLPASSSRAVPAKPKKPAVNVLLNLGLRAVDDASAVHASASPASVRGWAPTQQQPLVHASPAPPRSGTLSRGVAAHGMGSSDSGTSASLVRAPPPPPEAYGLASTARLLVTDAVLNQPVAAATPDRIPESPALAAPLRTAHVPALLHSSPSASVSASSAATPAPTAPVARPSLVKSVAPAAGSAPAPARLARTSSVKDPKSGDGKGVAADPRLARQASTRRMTAVTRLMMD